MKVPNPSVVMDEAGNRQVVTVWVEVPDLGPGEDIRVSITGKAAAALRANAAFLALPSPATAQVTAQVQRLTRECNAVIRLLLGLLDADDA